MLFKLAWRNVWRNKRRTFITAAAVGFAVFFSIVMLAFQTGIWQNLEDKSIKSFFGFAQVHGIGYADEQSLDKSFDLADAEAKLKDIDGLLGYIPRLESYGLASNADATTGAMIIGINPKKEDAMTSLKEKLIKGEYIAENDKGTLIGEGLSEKLNLNIGDTLVLLSQGYHGVNAAGKFPVKGILKFPIPDLNKRLVYMTLPTAQYFYGAEGRATTMVLDMPSRKDVPAIQINAEAALGDTYEVKNWQSMMPSLVETRQLKEGSNNVIIGILYLIVGFGIFGTILMMTKEREYEFGVLTSIGMRREKLAIIIWLETVLVGFLGAFLGMALSYPILYSVYKNPPVLTGEAAEAIKQFGFEMEIIPAMDWSIFSSQAIIIFILTTILAAYPFWKITRLKPVEAMRA